MTVRIVDLIVLVALAGGAYLVREPPVIAASAVLTFVLVCMRIEREQAPRRVSVPLVFARCTVFWAIVIVSAALPLVRATRASPYGVPNPLEPRLSDDGLARVALGAALGGGLLVAGTACLISRMGGTVWSDEPGRRAWRWVIAAQIIVAASSLACGTAAAQLIPNEYGYVVRAHDFRVVVASMCTFQIDALLWLTIVNGNVSLDGFTERICAAQVHDVVTYVMLFGIAHVLGSWLGYRALYPLQQHWPS